MKPPAFLQDVISAAGVVVEVIVKVRSNVLVKMLVAIAYFVTLRVGVGAVIVTLLRIVWPEIEVTGSGVIVVVAFAVDVIVNVWVGAVDVEVTVIQSAVFVSVNVSVG